MNLSCLLNKQEHFSVIKIKLYLQTISTSVHIGQERKKIQRHLIDRSMINFTFQIRHTCHFLFFKTYNNEVIFSF